MIDETRIQIAIAKAKLHSVNDWIYAFLDSGQDPRQQDLDLVVGLESKISELQQKIKRLTRQELCPTGQVGDP